MRACAAVGRVKISICRGRGSGGNISVSVCICICRRWAGDVDLMFKIFGMEKQEVMSV